MKRYLILGGVIVFVLLAGSVIYLGSGSRSSGRVDSLKLLGAARSYANELKAQHLPVPETVSLRELIARKLVADADVSGFAGMEVTVSLTADERHPQEVLIRARAADGHELVALADGSVQAK